MGYLEAFSIFIKDRETKRFILSAGLLALTVLILLSFKQYFYSNLIAIVFVLIIFTFIAIILYHRRITDLPIISVSVFLFSWGYSYLILFSYKNLVSIISKGILNLFILLGFLFGAIVIDSLIYISAENSNKNKKTD